MKLLIFPGAGDPDYENYRFVYDLLKGEALKLDFSEVIVVKYPGHNSYKIKSELKISSTIKVMIKHIQSFEKSNEEFIIICRSYGCSPFMDVIKILNGKIPFLKKAILWGATSFHLWHKLSFVDIEKSIKKGKKKGVNIAKDFFKELYSIENSINEVDNINFPVYFCSGDKDSYYPIQFHNYLKSICKNPNIHFPALIKDEGHEITNPNPEYLKLIFN